MAVVEGFENKWKFPHVLQCQWIVPVTTAIARSFPTLSIIDHLSNIYAGWPGSVHGAL